MRIAIASDWYLPRLGGIEMQMNGLAKALLVRGLDVTVVTTTPGADSGEVPIRRVPSLRLPPFDLAISPNLLAKLRDEFTRGGYDLIHAHISVVSPVGYGAVVVAQNLGIPVVVTFCGALLRSSQFLHLTDRLIGWSRWPIVVTAVSTLIASQLQTALPGLEVGILPNGIDVDYWRRSGTLDRKGERVEAVAAMRLNRKKRPLALLQAASRARHAASAQGRRLRLRIAGDGPMRNQLERYAADQEIADSVEFVGMMTRDQLADLYRSADFFAQASLHESFGIAALEARCAGLPVVAMSATGSSDFLKDNETALLAADDHEFFGSFTRLVLDDGLRHRLRDADPHLGRFNWPSVADAHIASFQKAIALMRQPRTDY